MLGKVIFLGTAAVAAALGWTQLFRFSTTPGQQFAAPAQLSAQLPAEWLSTASFPQHSISVAPALPLLLAFIHPQCSCTQAALQQLDALLDAPGANPQIVLAVYQTRHLARPHDVLQRSALPAASAWLHHPFQVVPDFEGALAQRFGAATSGEIILYAAARDSGAIPAARRLLFQGGITPERGHLGDNAGLTALRAALHSAPASAGPLPVGRVPAPQFSVFGCPIFRPPPSAAGSSHDATNLRRSFAWLSRKAHPVENQPDS